MLFPRLVYKSASTHLLTNDENEHDAALAGGWFDSVPEALAPKVAGNPVPAQSRLPEQALAEPKTEPDVDNAPPTRDEMKAKAAELGLVIAHNISNIKLAEMIEQALADKG